MKSVAIGIYGIGAARAITNEMGPDRNFFTTYNDLAFHVRKTERGAVIQATCAVPTYGGVSKSFTRRVSAYGYIYNAVTRCYQEAARQSKLDVARGLLFNDFDAQIALLQDNDGFLSAVEEQEQLSGHSAIYADMTPKAISFWRQWLTDNLSKWEGVTK